jgi:hypothetical protein
VCTQSGEGRVYVQRHAAVPGALQHD